MDQQKHMRILMAFTSFSSSISTQSSKAWQSTDFNPVDLSFEMSILRNSQHYFRIIYCSSVFALCFLLIFICSLIDSVLFSYSFNSLVLLYFFFFLLRTHPLNCTRMTWFYFCIYVLLCLMFRQLDVRDVGSKYTTISIHTFHLQNKEKQQQLHYQRQQSMCVQCAKQ